MESNWDKIKPIVEEKVRELRNADAFDPQTLALKIVELSSWWASVNKEVVERQYWYNVLLKNLLMEYKSVAKATVYAQATKEFKDYKEAEAYSKSILEVIRGGRRFTRLAEAEKQSASY